MSHTPGPWKVVDRKGMALPSSLSVCDDELSSGAVTWRPIKSGKQPIALVVDVNPHGSGIRRPSYISDAHVLSAAPDLLAALENLADAFAFLAVNVDQIDEPAYVAARAAIAKATGAKP